MDFPDYDGELHGKFYDDEPTWVPILPMTSVKEGTRLMRTQFPLAAAFALTVNKAQGLTLKEGVVIHLVGGGHASGLLRNTAFHSSHGHAPKASQ